MKNIGLITLLLVSMGIIAGCNSGGGGGGGSSGGYQYSSYSISSSCSQISGVIYESVTYSITSVSPSAYFQLGTTVMPTGVISYNSQGNCSAAQISGSPVCTYSFIYESTTAISPIQLQLNGSLGIQNITTFNIGGSCIK